MNTPADAVAVTAAGAVAVTAAGAVAVTSAGAGGGTAAAAAAAAAAGGAVAASGHPYCRSSYSSLVRRVHLSRHFEHPHYPDLRREQRGRVPSNSSAQAPSTSTSPHAR